MATNTPESMLWAQPSSATAHPTSEQPNSSKPFLDLIQDLVSIWEFSDRILASLRPFVNPELRNEAAKIALAELSKRWANFHAKYNTTTRTLSGQEQALIVVMRNIVNNQVCQDWRMPPALTKIMWLTPTLGPPESADLNVQEGITLRGGGSAAETPLVIPDTWTIIPSGEESLRAWRDLIGEEDAEGGWQIRRVLQALRESAKGKAEATEEVVKPEDMENC